MPNSIPNFHKSMGVCLYTLTLACLLKLFKDKTFKLFLCLLNIYLHHGIDCTIYAIQRNQFYNPNPHTL